MRIVVPDQRHVPATAGAILTNGAVRVSGIFPSSTIGSEKTIRISFPSSRDFSSPCGPVLTTLSAAVCATAETATGETQKKHRNTRMQLRKADFMGDL